MFISGTFVNDTGGTFVSDTTGTFVSDTGGTFGVILSIIESDEKNTGGCYLFFHMSLDEPCEADLWFSNIEAAKKQANINYGIDFEMWMDYHG